MIKDMHCPIKLFQRPVAIVSPLAGTTRDALETCLDVGGFPVVVVDTAGLRDETDDPIEREGIRRALDNARSADLIVLVLDASVTETTETEFLMESAREILDKFRIERGSGTRTIVIANKCDLVKERGENSAEVKFVSCKTDAGVDAAIADLTEILRELCATSLGESPLLTRQRHRLHLEKALGHLGKSCPKMFMPRYIEMQTWGQLPFLQKVPDIFTHPLRGLPRGCRSRDRGLCGERSALEVGPARARPDIGQGQFGANS